VLPLTEAFLMEFSQRFGRPPAGVSREARRILLEYHWPGNVRELHNCLERAAILCEGGLITPEHLTLSARRGASAAPPTAATPTAPAVESAGSGPAEPPATDLPSVERKLIAEALEHARYNKSKAARALGLTRQQLYVRMRRHWLQ
jgi:DNA-binding NtrC family response regulator